MTHWHIKSHACSKLPATGKSQIPKDADNSFQITGATNQRFMDSGGLALSSIKQPKICK